MEILYVLEVQKFVTDPLEDKGFYHVGYMKKVFKNKKEAVDYYNKHNSHMRDINGFNNYRSDWDPQTKLRYVVRSYLGEKCLINAFEDNI